MRKSGFIFALTSGAATAAFASAALASVTLAPEAFASSAVMPGPGAAAFAGSFTIIVRESLEAVLLISAMVAALTAMGAKKSVKFVHLGWAAAVAAGIATWWATAELIRITEAQAELVEGVTSLLAAAVLFYVSYWLISKIDAGKWKRYIDSKVAEAAGAGNTMAITTVAFLAVYREALETVLFFRALLFETSATHPVLWGIAAGAAVAGAVSVAVFKFSVRLPVRYLFSVTGLALCLLSFMLAGKGVHELQEVGIISETVAGFVPKIGALGIYPTYETLAPQALIAAALVFAAVKVSAVFSDKSAGRA